MLSPVASTVSSAAGPVAGRQRATQRATWQRRESRLRAPPAPPAIGDFFRFRVVLSPRSLARRTCCRRSRYVDIPHSSSTARNCKNKEQTLPPPPHVLSVPGGRMLAHLPLARRATRLVVCSSSSVGSVPVPGNASPSSAARRRRAVPAGPSKYSPWSLNPLSRSQKCKPRHDGSHCQLPPPSRLIRSRLRPMLTPQPGRGGGVLSCAPPWQRRARRPASMPWV